MRILVSYQLFLHYLHKVPLIFLAVDEFCCDQHAEAWHVINIEIHHYLPIEVFHVQHGKESTVIATKKIM